MNCYFVFEGKTESIAYKTWLSYLLPELIEVEGHLTTIRGILDRLHFYLYINLQCLQSKKNIKVDIVDLHT